MSFDNVVGGKLNLKGGALPVVGGIKKKKKKAKTNELALAQATHDDEGHEASPTGKQEDRRTEAEKRYAEKARKAEERIVQRMAEKGNREKIQEFNQYLSKLSEHYDIPRVGPG